MTLEANKALVQRFVDAYNRFDLEALGETVAVDFIEHGDSGQSGREALLAYASMLHTAFPDITNTIEDIIAEGDKVVTRTLVRGTHLGEMMGMPPTGRQISIATMNSFRVANGKLAEHWAVADTFGMMQQLGVISAPGSTQH